MASALPILGAAIALLALYRLVIFPLFLSPLSRIPPAHWSAPLSPIWILLARRRHRENRTLRLAHAALGPVVRVGPAALSVDGPEALRTVYQGGFEKWSWYEAFAGYGQPNMFSTTGSREHAARKRAVAHVYSKSFVHASPAARAQARAILFGRLLPLLARSADPDQTPPPHGIDVFGLFLAAAMDFISAYVYGLRCGTDFVRRKAQRDHWLELYLGRASHHFWPQELPGLTGFARRWLGVRLYPAWVDDANRELAEWNLGLCKKAGGGAAPRGREPVQTSVDEKEREAGIPPADEPADEPTVFRALNAGLDKEADTNGVHSVLYATALRDRGLAVASELFDHVTAGQETTGIALTYLSWHLSRSPSLQADLRAELLTLSPPLTIPGRPGSTSNAAEPALPDSLPDPKRVDALPLLHAVLIETLRLHAPIPGPQPRRTPPQGCRIGGYDVPGGVRVASLAHTLHANEEVFPDPERWDPGRWMSGESSEEEVRQRYRYFWAFGSGGRMCVGSNFAMNEMKYIVAAIYSNFTTHVVDDEGMEQLDAYTSRPASNRLFLRFEPV